MERLTVIAVWVVSVCALGRCVLAVPHELGHWSVRRFILGWPASIRLAASRGVLRKLTICGVRLRLGRDWWRISRRSILTVPWPIDRHLHSLSPARRVLLLSSGAAVNALEGAVFCLIATGLNGAIRRLLLMWGFVALFVAAGNLLPAYDSDGMHIARHAGHPKAVGAGLALIAVLLLALSVLAVLTALR